MSKDFFSACHLLFNFVYYSFEVWKFENIVIKYTVLFLYYLFYCLDNSHLFSNQLI